jgi:phosphatidylglycerol---prolipoprotein diacylglyceryl transferase
MDAYVFPHFDPVAFALGPVVIRWYALAYMAGFILGWRYCILLSRRFGAPPTEAHLDDFLLWAGVGVILGGRLGFVLFYNAEYFFANPLEILKVWSGGMSFHGGFLGVVLATLLFARHQGWSPFRLGDLLACASPIGLFLGRIANFVNAELWGRPTAADWGVIFPGPLAGGVPRHPSQLYEAALEGLLLFIILALLARRPAVFQRTGTLTAIFLIGYGLSRIIAEFFREPDLHIGYLAFGVTMGQLLSIPMVLVGLVILWRAPFGASAARPDRV